VALHFFPKFGQVSFWEKGKLIETQKPDAPYSRKVVGSGASQVASGCFFELGEKLLL